MKTEMITKQHSVQQINTASHLVREAQHLSQLCGSSSSLMQLLSLGLVLRSRQSWWNAQGEREAGKGTHEDKPMRVD